MSKTLSGGTELTDIDSITFTQGSTTAHMQAVDGGIEYNFNLPHNSGNPGDLLTSQGDNLEMTWTPATFGTGSVTSVDVNPVPAFLTSSGGPITTTGTISIGLSGIPLPVANGGTGTITSTGTGDVVLSNNSTLTGITNVDELSLTVPLSVADGGTGGTGSTGTGPLVLQNGPTINSATLTATTLSLLTTALGDVDIQSTTTSTSPITGALKVAGGVGIDDTLNVSGDTKLLSNTPSTSATTGALVVQGGTGISGDLVVGGTITGIISPPSMSTSGVITTTNTTQSISTITGAIVAPSGGLGIGLNANIGGDIHAGGRITTTDTTPSTSATTGSVTTPGGVGIGGDLHVGGFINGSLGAINTSGPIITTSTATSTSPTTGAIVASAGGLGVKGNINTDGIITTYNATNSTNFANGAIVAASGGLGVWSNANIGGNLNVNGLITGNQTSVSTTGLITSNNSTQSTSSSTGAITTQGGLGVVRDLYVGGSTVVSQSISCRRIKEAALTSNTGTSKTITSGEEHIFNYTGSQANFIYRLPSATGLNIGEQYTFIAENSPVSIIVQDNSTNPLGSTAGMIRFILVYNGSAAGTWLQI